MASELKSIKEENLAGESSVNVEDASPPNARKFEVEAVREGEDKAVDDQPDRTVRFNSNANEAAPEQEEVGKNCLEEVPESPKSPDEMATIGYATHEAVPMTLYYRNQGSQESSAGKNRPTLLDLRKGFKEMPEENEKTSEETSPNEADDPEKGQTVISERRVAGPKFGWVKGVLFSCLLNIWGVMLYLRLSWVVGQAGIGLASVIILMSAIVTTLTTLSMSAICTNGEIKGGGSYYLISRSLGPEFGGAIGFIFSIASAVAVAMYVVGFAETLRDILKESGHSIVDGDINDIRIIGIVTMFFVLGVALVGMKWVIRAQVILLVILVASIVDVVIGSFIGPQNTKIKNQGFIGYKSNIFNSNFSPDYRGKESFFTVFAVFFPAATGILAGVNISGDLKNSGQAIPKGTLLAILISSCVYLLLAWIAGSCVEREALGSLAALGGAVINSMNIGLPSNTTQTCATASCKYGLLHDFQIMEMISGWGPIVTAGIFASTLSSALASLVGAPKTFQAVCKDKLFPGISYFAKGNGPGDEPRRGYILAFFIALACVAIAELNTIASIISNFFLIVYALINYSVFAASLGHSPGWRPSFKYYNMWVSLIGALLCVAIMFLISWWAALVTILIVSALYKYVDYKKPEVNWGSSAQAFSYISALRYVTKLESVEDHVKNFRPQCLVLSGRPASRSNLVYLASHITKNVGLMVYGHVTLGEFAANSEEALVEDRKWLKKHNIKAFRAATTAPSLRAGVQSMLSLTGLGKVKPNTLVLGFKNDWQKVQDDKVDEYVNIIKDAFELNYGVAILRVNENLQMEGEDEESLSSDEETEMTIGESKTKNEAETPLKAAEVKSEPQPLVNFESKQKGTVDVWWLFDDGGLTVLLPYLLSRHRSWSKCKLRIFTADIGSKQATIEGKKLRMVNLLKKFRIDYEAVVPVEGVNKRPSEESIEAFKKLPIQEELEEGKITDKKVLRNIRIGELVRDKSKDAKLIVMSLPVPVEGVTSSKMYMSWLEFLSMNLPPVLLVRGNQQSVLTFYS